MASAANPKSTSSGIQSGPCAYETEPPSLCKLCLSACFRNTQVLTVYDHLNKRYNLKSDVVLPQQVCEDLLETWRQVSERYGNGYVHLFSDISRTKLQRVCVKDTNITDEALGWLLAHNPSEVDISGCGKITYKTVELLVEKCSKLHTLHVDTTTFKAVFQIDQPYYFPSLEDETPPEVAPSPFVFPALKVLSLHGLCYSYFSKYEDVLPAEITGSINMSSMKYTCCMNTSLEVMHITKVTSRKT